MKEEFSMSSLQELQKGLQNLKKDKIDELKATGKMPASPQNNGSAKTGKNVLLELQQSLATGRPTSTVSLMNDIATLNETMAVDENKQLKKVSSPSRPVNTRANSRDDNDDFYDEQVRQRMEKAANKIHESVQNKPISEEHLYGTPQRKTNGGMSINEDQLFELAQKAVTNAIANMYTKEKIREVIMEEKKEIKKIIYETLQELREINEKKKATSK